MADDPAGDDPVDVTKLAREVADWEYVSRGLHSYTQRKAVPGGWIYRTVVENHPAMCFVPDVPAPPPVKDAPQVERVEGPYPESPYLRTRRALIWSASSGARLMLEKLVCPTCGNDDPAKQKPETRYWKSGGGGPHREGHILTDRTICKECKTVFRNKEGAPK